MQAAGPSLPEFDPCRFHYIAAPVRRALRVAPIQCIADFPLLFFQPLAAFDDFALRRGDSAYPAADGTAVEIIIADLFRGERHDTADPHLAFQCGPEKYEAGPGILEKLVAFCAVVVGKEA